LYGVDSLIQCGSYDTEESGAGFCASCGWLVPA
jgi:hypothetical protein